MERQEIGYCESTMELSFLGAGFPLFYIFLKVCILILTVQTFVKHVYNLATNIMGDYCEQLVRYEMEGGQTTEEPLCPSSILLRISIANKLK